MAEDPPRAAGTTWHEFPSSSLCAQALARDVAAALAAAIAARGRAGLAVSGGQSPAAAFEALSNAELDWGAVTITLVDERFVPAAHPDSNEHLVRACLMRGRASQARFEGLVSDPADIDACVTQANRQRGGLAVVMLGMGEDGHTASLFPGAAQLRAGLNPSNPYRYLRIKPPVAPHERISMTLGAILSAGRIALLISGARKREVFEQASRGADPALPVSLIINQTGVGVDVYWHP